MQVTKGADKAIISLFTTKRRTGTLLLRWLRTGIARFQRALSERMNAPGRARFQVRKEAASGVCDTIEHDRTTYETNTRVRLAS